MKDKLVGFTGMIAAGGSVAVSNVDAVKEWLQIATLAGGLIVTILTIYSVSLSIKIKRQNKKDINEQ